MGILLEDGFPDLLGVARAKGGDPVVLVPAIRPDVGLSNGREVSLFNVAQASSLISAFSVVLSDLYGSFAPRK